MRTLDIAKRLIDFGIHPPTVYFPLIVEEAMMVEPTEAETKDTLDAFVEVMRQIAREAEDEPGADPRGSARSAGWTTGRDHGGTEARAALVMAGGPGLGRPNVDTSTTRIEEGLGVAVERKPLLEVKNLKTQFFTHDGVVKAVNGVSFTLDEGEALGLVGESGCGKSVSALSLMRLIPTPPGRIVDGEVIFDGKDLLKLNDEEIRQIRGNEIAMIFQDPMTSLNPVLTIGRQIAEALELHKGMNRTQSRKRDDRAAGAGRHPGRASRASTTTRTSSPAACASA